MKETYQMLSRLLGHSSFYLAGGCVVRHIQEDDSKGDYDLFFLDFEKYTETCNLLKLHCEISQTSMILKERKNSILFLINELELDIIYQDKENMIQVIGDFDLLHCCHYYDHINDVLVSGGTEFQSSFDAAKNKALILHNKNKNPYITLKRIAKFLKRDYWISSCEEQEILNLCYNYEDKDQNNQGEENGSY